MVMFKTLDIRGLSFFNAFQEASKAFSGIKKNGALEIISDRKKILRMHLKPGQNPRVIKYPILTTAIKWFVCS